MKYREFWVIKDHFARVMTEHGWVNSYCATDAVPQQDESFHVIEKSAYLELEAKLKKLESDIEIAGDYCAQIAKVRVDELEAKLNYYKDHAEMMKEAWDKSEAKLAECVAALELIATPKGVGRVAIANRALAKVKK